MGWTFLYNVPDKHQAIELCTRESNTLKCILKAIHGNNLWTVWDDSQSKKKTIILFRLGKDNGNWGYKDVTEYQGPSYYDCPESFLSIAPCSNKDWRGKVHCFHLKERENKEIIKSLEVGMMIKLKDSKPSEFRVVSLKPLLGMSKDGRTYKLIKNRIIGIND
jgi:hypothetical protein